MQDFLKGGAMLLHNTRVLGAIGLYTLLLISGARIGSLSAQPINPAKGVDPRVDYSAMKAIGPWDDRNYLVTRKDLALLAPNEHELKDPIPVFFRIELRKANPGMLRTGPAQYPRSALQIFQMRYGGYLVGNRLYKSAVYRDGRFEVVQVNGVSREELEDYKLLTGEALTGEVRITSPLGAAESAVKIHPTDVNKVVAGSNGPGFGQIMWYSTNAGSSWTQAAALPQGGTCCDPTVDWSSNGQYAYTTTLGGCVSGALCNVWVYRSADGGATWNDLATITPGDGRREVTSSGTSDKQYIHVDKYATSSYRDNIYQCWHDHNTLKFSRSTDFAHTWSAPLTMSSGSSQTGIGCDLTTDKNGNVYYFWPATSSQTILARKSTNGGSSFNTAVTVANTQGSYDFAIPAMETRRAFIYASADADLSNGAFANSIYVSWTDATASESSTPSNNHARIQVAYSRDGGATWTVRTPHSTADQSTVDRFHPWLAVGGDGTVYVVFYDTRNSANRTGVDFYYSKSTDGGETWSVAARLTGVTSPNLTDNFEWGDYNGLDIVASQFLSVFTDNRNESGGSGNSADVYAASPTTAGGTPYFSEEYLGNADLGQCGYNSATFLYGSQDTAAGTWTMPVRIDTDNRSGGCSQRFRLADPSGQLSGLVLKVDFQGTANQCAGTGIRSIVPNGSWSSIYWIDTDDKAGYCTQTFSIEGRSDLALDVNFEAESNNGQCGNVGTFPVVLGRSATFILDTDERSGGCRQKFRLRLNSNADGDGVGDASDSCPYAWSSNPSGCGSACGNSMCESGESSANCCQDCGAYCGNGLCQTECGESEWSCPSDCDSSSGPCGDGFCDVWQGECASNCPQDCVNGEYCQ
jgi:hypothetical protein